MHQRSGLSRSCKSKSSYLVTSPGRDCVYNYQPASRRSLAQLASNKNVTRKASMDTFTSWLPSRRKRFVTNIIVISFIDICANIPSELDHRPDKMQSRWKTYNHQIIVMVVSGKGHSIFTQWCPWKTRLSLKSHDRLALKLKQVESWLMKVNWQWKLIDEETLITK